MIKEWCGKCDGSGRHGIYGGEKEKVVCPYCQGKGYTELKEIDRGKSLDLDHAIHIAMEHGKKYHLYLKEIK